VQDKARDGRAAGVAAKGVPLHSRACSARKYATIMLVHEKHSCAVTLR
jgi:hypothetical protein